MQSTSLYLLAASKVPSVGTEMLLGSHSSSAAGEWLWWKKSFNWKLHPERDRKIAEVQLFPGKNLSSAVLCLSCRSPQRSTQLLPAVPRGNRAQTGWAAGPCSSTGPCRACRFWLLLVALPCPCSDCSSECCSWWTTCVCCILPTLPSVLCALLRFNTPPVWLALAQEMLSSAWAASGLSKVIRLGWCVPPCTGFPAVECFMALWHLVNTCRG